MKFPRMHIAESVVNRILNVADGLPNLGPPAVSAPPPIVPDASQLGAALDQEIATGAPQALPGLDQAPDPGATVSGKPLMATLLDPNDA